ncbi:serine/threonine-protein kinase [Planctomyces sp. SH-PL62]|uniref:serine/threonine-protein kinase n=1 Tax=Planctomyces sp. SH-PL62 TaxID=1636152 RepID=UPI00078D3B38|nr:serine/threonine-protein kinase [Planctomyces sp. SH-PL62]AMV37520.1 Serine/threonine-protein kinase PknD [Planctomyces sp. SH-PL62]
MSEGVGSGFDEQVLSAVLAGLTGAVSRESASSILAEWSRAPGASLAEMLQDLGGLDEERLRTLAALASAHYEAHGRDLGRSLAAWNVGADPLLGPTEADSLATLAAPSSGHPGEASAARAPSPSRPPYDERYELINIHAKGGIGQVWKARDRQLQRQVALKELQPPLAHRDDLRARFLLEAEITGKLEHPGIVPVYSLGEDEEGRPFYAMRFIQGDSLAVAIRDFHKSRTTAEAAGADPEQSWGVEFRQLLRRFLGACDTLEYAHSQGCIHRDLKPGNIMVGPYGETLVVDWGLAKVIGPGASADIPPSGEGSFTSSGSGTSPGDWIGTPSYMSPEQAVGDLQRIGPRSDVYSLGATLYELLTGEPPFRGADPHTVIAAVLRGPSPPKAVVRSIPPALESVCLKAMARSPRDRYDSAAALARDVDNWLADEPVSAHPEGPRERLSRWIRRHRTWAYAAAAALLGISLVATAAAFAINRAWRGERDAHVEAEHSFDLAQQAVDESFTRISQDTLLSREDSVDLRRLRAELLGTALKYYQGFVADRRDDPRLRRRLATAYHNVGVVQAVIASPREAVGPFASALSTWNELLGASPGDADLIAGRADTLRQLGKARNAMDQPRAALDVLNLAVADLESLAALPSPKPYLEVELADSLSDIAATEARLGRFEESRAASTRARQVLRRLLDADPGNAFYREALAEVINNQGYAAFTAGDSTAALDAFREFQGLCLDLLRDAPVDAPRPLRLVELLSLSYENVGDILTTRGLYDEADEAYAQSLARGSELATAHPSVQRYRMQLGRTYRERGHAQHRIGDDADALRSLDSAREVFEGLIRQDPDRATLHHHLARTWNTIGCFHDDLRDHEAALGPFRSAIAEHRLALAGAPDAPGYRFHFVLSLANLAEQYTDRGELDEAAPIAAEAARAALEVIRGDAALGGRFAICVDVAATIGDLTLQAGDAPGAIARFEELAATIREGRSAPSAAAREDALAAAETRRVVGLIVEGRSDEAAAALRELEARLRGRPEPAARDRLSEVLWLRARVARLQGRGEEAADADAGRVGLWDARSARGLVASASRAAARACLVGYGRSPLPTAAGEAARAIDADRAADDLRLALHLGYDDRARLRDDLGLMTILDRAADRALHDDLGFPDPPFAPPPTPRDDPSPP